MNVSLEEIKDILQEWDKRSGSYLEHEWEGLCAFNVIVTALQKRHPNENIPNLDEVAYLQVIDPQPIDDGPPFVLPAYIREDDRRGR